VCLVFKIKINYFYSLCFLYISVYIIIILIINYYYTQTNKQILKQNFAKDLVTTFSGDFPNAKFAIIQFADTVKVEVALSDAAVVEAAVASITQIHGETATAAALNAAQNLLVTKGMHIMCVCVYVRMCVCVYVCVLIQWCDVCVMYV